jgi:hypothetical protein
MVTSRVLSVAPGNRATRQPGTLLVTFAVPDSPMGMRQGPSLHDILYERAPLQRPSLAELSRSAPVTVTFEGNGAIVAHDGRTFCLDDRDGRLQRVFRAVQTSGPWVIVDGRLAA